VAHLQARGLGGRLPRDHQVSDTVIRTVQNFVQARLRGEQAGRAGARVRPPGRRDHVCCCVASRLLWTCQRAPVGSWARGLRMLSRLRLTDLPVRVREEKDVESKKSRIFP
jgi:hypothetical protein